jgi:chromosomal replication initiation ATPase DnaA
MSATLRPVIVPAQATQLAALRAVRARMRTAAFEYERRVADAKQRDAEQQALAEIKRREEARWPSVKMEKSKRITLMLCRVHKVGLRDVKGETRMAHIVAARQQIFYALNKYTKLSQPEIGRRFGGRDHTTVMHAVHKIAAQRAAIHAERKARRMACAAALLSRASQ